MRNSPPHYNATLLTPIGIFSLRMLADKVVETCWLTTKAIKSIKSEPDSIAAVAAVRQINNYFTDARADLNLPLAIQGTPFQCRVWEILRSIPPGQVLTYGNIAHRLDSSPRAVGSACRANPLPILIPCHRVVAKSGLGGYSGALDGHPLAIKAWLIKHEESLGQLTVEYENIAE